jgi:hypothetical protein
MEGSGACRSAEKLVEKGSLGGNKGKDWWRGIDLVIFNFAFELRVALYQKSKFVRPPAVLE